MMGPWRPKKRRFVKHAVVYIARSGAQALVVGVHHNGVGGVLVEDDEVITVSEVDDAAALSNAVLTALESSSIRPEVNLRDCKLSDWAAYRASRERSGRQFEADYIPLRVFGANDANIILEIEGAPKLNADLRVRCAASPRSPEVGAACLRVWKACRDRCF